MEESDHETKELTLAIQMLGVNVVEAIDRLRQAVEKIHNDGLNVWTNE